jgi:hypothetical protein
VPIERLSLKSISLHPLHVGGIKLGTSICSVLSAIKPKYKLLLAVKGRSVLAWEDAIKLDRTRTKAHFAGGLSVKNFERLTR